MLIRLLFLSLSSYAILAPALRAQNATGSSAPSAPKPIRQAANLPPKSGSTPVVHEVRKGETLWSIAQDYGKSVGEMMDANRMKDDKVWKGLKLRIPQSASESKVVDPTPSKPKIQDDGKTRYSVVAGNTFSGIASKHGITMKALQEANPQAIPTRLQIGQQLIIPPKVVKPKVTVEAPAKESKKVEPVVVQHEVGERETFYSIAKKYGLTTQQMVDANPTIQPERLRKGLKVIVPITPKAPIASEGVAVKPEEELVEKEPVTPKPKFVGSAGSQKLHVVRKGENFYSISRLHKVSVDEIKVQNRLTSRDVLKEGDQLIIPVTAAKP